MEGNDKLFLKILRGDSDKNIRFNDLCQLMKRLGFEERVRGSHHIFRKKGIIEKVNLQKDKDKAKAYQVRQVRDIIHKYNLKVG
jgi:predicted RNA binding protein YcfA (HicA-like mRNA interferase family)